MIQLMKMGKQQTRRILVDSKLDDDDDEKEKFPQEGIVSGKTAKYDEEAAVNNDSEEDDDEQEKEDIELDKIVETLKKSPAKRKKTIHANALNDDDSPAGGKRDEADVIEETRRKIEEKIHRPVVKVEFKLGIRNETEKSLDMLSTTNDLYSSKCSWQYRVLVILVSCFQVTLLSLLIKDSVDLFAESVACYSRADFAKFVIFFNPFVASFVTYYLTGQVSPSSFESVVNSRMHYFPESNRDFIFYVLVLLSYLIALPFLMFAAIPFIIFGRPYGEKISMFFDIACSSLCGVTVFFIVASYLTPAEMIINMLGVLAVMEFDSIVCFFAKIPIMNVVVYTKDEATNLSDEINKATQAFAFLMFLGIYCSLDYNYFYYICTDEVGVYQQY
jgi:hypothetical protein